MYTCKHGLNNYKDTKPSMSPLLVFNRVYRLEIYSQSCWYIGIQCVTGGGGGVLVMWRVQYIQELYEFDQVPNLQNCFITPNKNQGEEGASER
jgi:hypothetical protein